VTEDQTEFHAGYVTIVGRPNVGKSTLLNTFLGMKLAIISPKPQTTRHRLLGVLTGDNYQIVFLDTPGLLRPRYELQQAMLQAAEAAIADADILLFMIEATETPNPHDLEALEKLIATNKPIVLVINKIDLIAKSKLLPLIDTYRNQHEFADIVPISALLADGISILLETLVKLLPVSPPFYPPDFLTEHTERFLVAEIVREKVFQLYGEEIPYSTSVQIDEYQEHPEGKDFIRATIYVEKESQRRILIGKKGAALKRVGELARADIENLVNHPVYLELWVKVREKWRKKARDVREFGYGPTIRKL